MHVVATKNSTLPLFFNVDSSVGNNGADSSTEDILLVQFFLHILSEAWQTLTPPPGVPAQDWNDLLATAGEVQMNGTCDIATIAAIGAFQNRYHDEHPTIVVDGQVSIARGIYYAPEGAWSIALLTRQGQS